jgi:hypothetical protein
MSSLLQIAKRISSTSRFSKQISRKITSSVTKIKQPTLHWAGNEQIKAAGLTGVSLMNFYILAPYYGLSGKPVLDIPDRA